MPRVRASSKKARKSSAGYSTPAGLLGEISTIARRPIGDQRRAQSGSGKRSSPVGGGRLRTPSMLSPILVVEVRRAGAGSPRRPRPQASTSRPVKAWFAARG